MAARNLALIREGKSQSEIPRFARNDTGSPNEEAIEVATDDGQLITDVLQIQNLKSKIK
jgi:hypothetical protein